MQVDKFYKKLSMIAIIIMFFAVRVDAEEQTVVFIIEQDGYVLIITTGVIELKKLEATIDGKHAKITPVKEKLNEVSFFKVEVPSESASGSVIFNVKYDGKKIGTKTINLPNLLVNPGEQPELFKLHPIGGIQGDTITIVGKNFGSDLNKIKVQLDQREERDELNVFTELARVSPIVISKPDNQTKRQELKFSIPTDQNFTEDHLFSNNLHLRVLVDKQPSNYLTLTVAQPYWRWIAVVISVLLIGSIIVLLRFVAKDWKFLRWLFIDKKTNTFSLSKFQATAWTVVLIGGYFLLALGSAIFIGKESIPDFNPSLLALLGISLGGTLAARGVNVRFPKKDLEGSERQLNNLISEGGEISLPRLQLLGFTITAIAIYITYLISTDLFTEGLPDLPPTLLALLGISQGGYIGGKMVGGQMAVNYVMPRKAMLDSNQVTLTITGSGFKDNTKAFFGNYQTLLEAKLVNPNSATLSLPKQALSKAGWQQLILVPPAGGSLFLDAVIEVVDAKIQKVEWVSGQPKQVKLTLKGFDLKDIKCTIGGNQAKLVHSEEVQNQVIFASTADIQEDDEVIIISTDGLLEAKEKVPQP